ncbi:MAG: hypothetical protein RLZZ618_3310 [Pseudomonadota bacterium]|jgi:hypothetical protein
MPACPQRRKLILTALVSAAPLAWSAEEPENVKGIRLALADAFATQDRRKIGALILDTHSGLRLFTFSKENSAYWEDAGRALREARFVSSGTDKVMYAIYWPTSGEYKKERHISFLRRDVQWELDFASFMGPFPHL